MFKLKKLKKNVACMAAILLALLGLDARLLAQEQPSPAGEQPTPAAPTAMTTPAMTGPLAANPNPFSFDAGPLGPVYVTGAVSGLGLWQNNIFPDQQYKIFFARAEISHVGTSSTARGLVFGPNGTNTTQTRGMIELGILF
jgi:hypothetical protein